MKNRLLSATALFLTGAMLFAGCGQADSNATSSSSSEASTETFSATAGTSSETSEDNTMFSDMETTDLDGNTVTSSIFSDNKVTLVNVWNVGCTPCVQETPELDRVNQEFAGKGAAVYGLYCDFGMGITDDEMTQIQDIMTNANASYTQLRMDGTLKENSTLLNLMAFPTTFVVGSDGTILDTIEGSNDYEGWKSVIESYLSEAE